MKKLKNKKIQKIRNGKMKKFSSRLELQVGFPDFLISQFCLMASRLSEEFRDRTKRFAASVIRLYVSLPRDREEVRVCGKQLLRSGTSVAAHVREASRARSDQEFVSKIGGALQEIDESSLWLELLNEECRISSSSTDPIKTEANELLAIMSSMLSRATNRQ